LEEQLRVVISDYSGHPFQVQLSRELARQGHAVLHLYYKDFQTPKGKLSVDPLDPDTLAIESISLNKPFAKQSFLKRRSQEIAVGKKIAERIIGFRPDVVVGSNLPLDAVRAVTKRCRRAEIPFVFWQQDIYSIAITKILTKKWGPLGALIGSYYRSVERAALNSSDQIVAISPDFVPYLTGQFGVKKKDITVIENWAPLGEINPGLKDNPWSRARGLADTDVVLYTGTLGMKHDPGQLLRIARRLSSRPNTELVVVSEGPAAEWLMKQALLEGLKTLRVINFQPFAEYGDVLASANILLCILEDSAGAFSVPSKVLSYLCAGRPIVLLAPSENLSVRTIAAADAGISVPSHSSTELPDAVVHLLNNSTGCSRAGKNGRAYAERAFDIGALAERFTLVLTSAIGIKNSSASIHNRNSSSSASLSSSAL